jgi:hypothetical protein
LVWGWLEIYLGLNCGLLRIGSRFNEGLFGVVSGCISKLLVLYYGSVYLSVSDWSRFFFRVGSTFIYGW